MPLVKPLLELGLYIAFKKMQYSTDDIDSAQRELAADLASAIDSYVTSMNIIIPAGIAVATAGSPAAQTGASTAPSPPGIIT